MTSEAIHPSATPSALPSTATSAASIITPRMIDRFEIPNSRSAAMSRRRSSTLSNMMQSRKIALATIVITPIARWKRLTTRNVRDVSTAMSRDRCARKPNATPLIARSAESVPRSERVPMANRSTRSP
jgi:hypothetical protein